MDSHIRDINASTGPSGNFGIYHLSKGNPLTSRSPGTLSTGNNHKHINFHSVMLPFLNKKGLRRNVRVIQPI